MPPTSRRILGLFAKWPEPGAVKTRLAAASSPEWAAQVAKAFLRDSVERFAGIDAERILAFTPAAAQPLFARLVQERFALMPQADGDLGQRLAAFVTTQLAAGAERVVLLGTDSPTLPLDYVEQAFQFLERADVVLGPATDGGYYLVGCAHRLPPIFSDVRWSSPSVLADTVERLDDVRWRLAVLPPWYDVDTLEDWNMLRGHLTALWRAGVDPGVPRTEHLTRSPLP